MLKTVGFPSIRTGDQTIVNGNLVIATAGKGIDFSATSDGTGVVTSEIFDDYERGTFTPTMTSAAGTTTLNSGSGSYTKCGNVVTAQIAVNITTDASVGTSNFTIGGLPYTSISTYAARGFVTGSDWTGSDLIDGAVQMSAAQTSMVWRERAVSASNRTGNNLQFIIIYRT